MTKRTAKLIIAVLMILAVCLYFIAGTYARYTSSITGNAKVDVAKWAVAFKNGDTPLQNNFDLTFEVEENDYVVSNKIAPDTTATAQIKIDLTGTEVAVDYTATVDKTSLATVFGASANDVTVTTSAEINGKTITDGYIPLNGSSNSAFTENNGVAIITITLTWTNNDEHNASDTTVGTTAGTLTLPVTLTVNQHIAQP